MEFRLLGSIEAQASGQSIPLGPPRQRGILAVLAADAGQLVLMDTLVDRVWGDKPPGRARHSLYAYVARLRGILAAAGGSAVLVRRTHGYVLDVAQDAVDIHRFRRLVVQARQPHQDIRTRTELLRAALAQWSGIPLAAMSGEWADAARQAWQQQHVDAVVEWAEAELSVSGPAAVIDTLTGMLTQHPLHEPLAGALMKAMHTAGRTSEALDIYARIRAGLAEQLGVDPSAPLQRVYQEVLRPDADLPTVTPAVPAQLPVDAGDFTGRVPELAALHERLAELCTGAAGQVVSAVTGAAGAGKTALVVHFGHQVRDRFPDGQVYVDLRGGGRASSVAVGDVLASVLRALGVTGREIPVGLDERAARYRGLLGRRRMLIVLDGASSAEQVGPLLPGSASCLVLVTSRDSLPGLTARHVQLGSLSALESIDLLRRLAGSRVDAEPGAVAELAARGGGLPLALRMTAALIAARPSSSLADIAGELDPPGPDRDASAGLAAVVARSYQHLPAQAQRAFRLLARHPDVDMDTVAALLGTTDVRPVRRVLETLTRAHLVEHVDRDRYRMHDVARTYAADVPVGSGSATGKTQQQPTTGHPALYDRDGQLATLRRLAAAALTGRGSVALVRGTAGMGKTALLDAWAAGAPAAGMRVTRASAGRSEQGFDFAVARQLLEPLAGTAAEVRSAGTRLPHDLMHGLYRLVVTACGDRPLALVVDDAQWADAPSLRWLDYLGRRIDGLPVLLVVAARPEGGPAEQLAGHVITVPELSPAAMTRWVRREWPDAAVEFRGACVRAAGGDPSLLAELVQALRDHGVEPVAEQAPRVAEFADRLLAAAAVRRLSGQDEATCRLARALVVLGDGADWPLAAALSGLSDAECRDRADRLVRIGLLAPGDTARFRHPSIRSMLAETAVAATELAAGHARAAELLYADGAPPEQVATHVLLADPGPGPWRVEVLREAARAARGRGLPETGARYLRRALREPASANQRGDLILELGADEVVTDPDAAARRLALALPELTDPLTRGRATSLLADALFAAYRHEQAMDVLTRAVSDLATPAGSDGIARELWWRLQAQRVLVGCECPAIVPTARDLAKQLRAFDIPGDTPGQRAVLLALAVPAMMGESDAATVNDLLDRGLRGELAADARAAYPLGVAGLGYSLTDRLDDAALRYDQMRELAGRCGATAASAQAVAGLSNVEWRRGQRIPVTPAFEGALRTDLRARLSLVTAAVESLIERGDPDTAAGIVAEHATGATDESVCWAPVLVSAGRVQAERGDLSGALALLLAYGRYEEQEGLGTPAATPWRSRAARICAALGQREQARQLATDGLDAAYRWGTARVIGAGLRCLGAVTGGAESLALLAEAVTVLEPSPARLELAWAKYEWGLAVRQAGDLRNGLDILGDALKLAELSGARLLAGRVRAELVAAGVRLATSP